MTNSHMRPPCSALITSDEMTKWLRKLIYANTNSHTNTSTNTHAHIHANTYVHKHACEKATTLSSQNSFLDAHGSFMEQRFFSVKFARFHNFFVLDPFRKSWNVGISNKLWDIQCWRKGRILLNLCGKRNVRNCDLSQRDFLCSV
jgi:hypothetical protein